MNRRNTVDRLSKRIMRIMTLLCFFSFSGLNNAFTYFVISAGRIQKVDITPALVEKSARLMYPVNWKKILSNSLRTRLFGHAKVIEFASQRAIQSFLFESSLMQIWLRDSISKILSTPNAGNLALAAEDRDSSGFLSLRGDPPEAGRRSNLDPKQETRSLRIARDDSESVMVWVEVSKGYLKSNRRQAWLMERSHFWNADKHRPGFLTFFYLARVKDHWSRGDPPPPIRITPQRSVIFFGSKMGERKIYASGDEEDDSNEAMTAAVAQFIPASQMRGSFFRVKL